MKNRIVRGAKIESAKFLDIQEIKKKILSNNDIKASSKDLTTPPSSEETLKSAEKAAYEKGLEEGQYQGYQTGFNEGIEQGSKKGATLAQEELKDTISMLNIIAMAFLVRKEELFELIKPEIVKLCLIICQKILQRELENPESFKNLLLKLLEQVKLITKDIPIDVIISSYDYEKIKGAMLANDLNQSSLPKIHLVADPLMERGNCRLETSIGMMNFDIERILQDLDTKIFEA